MIMNEDWTYLYKYAIDTSTELKLCRTNLLYSPTVSPDNDILCMDWNQNFYYHKSPRSQEILDWFFDREITNLKFFQDYDWCPEILDIDLSNKKIFIEFNGTLLNHLIFKEDSLDRKCEDWQRQIRNIINDLDNSNFYKVALYPHCFYLSSKGIVKTIDYYSCISKDERYFPLSMIQPIIGENSEERFKQATVDDKIDGKLLYDYTIKKHLDTVWPINPFKD